MTETLLAITTITLAFLFVITQIFWMKHAQKLVDKVMSRDFNDYTLAVKREKEVPKPKAQNIVPEDLGPLQEFMN